MLTESIVEAGGDVAGVATDRPHEHYLSDHTTCAVCPPELAAFL
jgi:hypothetical protein